jgi:hypothetical protein
MRKKILIFVMTFITFTAIAQSTITKTIGVEGQYGISVMYYENGAVYFLTEGILNNGQVSPLIFKSYPDGEGYITKESGRISLGSTSFTVATSTWSDKYKCVLDEETTYEKGRGKITRFKKCLRDDASRPNIIKDTLIDLTKFKEIFDAECEKRRLGIPGFNPELFVEAHKIGKGEYGTSTLSVSQLKEKQNLTKDDCKNLYESRRSSNYKDGIEILNLYLEKCCQTDADILDTREIIAFKHLDDKQYAKAIPHYKFCEQSYKTKNDRVKLQEVYSDLKKCYDGLGDAVNSKEYSSKIEQMKPISNQGGNKNFCFNTYNGNYKISLSDDGTYKGLYLLFDSNGEVTKTLQGKWTLQDEGVYGAAHKLTFQFTGTNSNLPSMKFTCQFNGDGKLQSLIDNQNRTWNKCN